MKKLFYAAAIAILAVGSYKLGKHNGYHNGCQKYDKVYDDASRMSDLIRCYHDHLNDSLIEDYGCFEELEEVFLYDDALGKPIDLEDYVYGY